MTVLKKGRILERLRMAHQAAQLTHNHDRFLLFPSNFPESGSHHSRGPPPLSSVRATRWLPARRWAGGMKALSSTTSHPRSPVQDLQARSQFICGLQSFFRISLECTLQCHKKTSWILQVVLEFFAVSMFSDSPEKDVPRKESTRKAGRERDIRGRERRPSLPRHSAHSSSAATPPDSPPATSSTLIL